MTDEGHTRQNSEPSVSSPKAPTLSSKAEGEPRLSTAPVDPMEADLLAAQDKASRKGHSRQYSEPDASSPDHPFLPSKAEDEPELSTIPIDPMESGLLAAQDNASRKRVMKETVLIGAGIFVCTICMIIVFLSYICVFHQCRVSKRSVISTAPLGPVLTISQVMSYLAPLSVPFIMGVLSYLASAMWLKSSEDDGPNRPSPKQLGYLMSMYDGAGLSSLFFSIQYIFKGPKNGQKISLPPIFRKCVVFLGSLLAITYLAAAADSWLHASSTSVSVLSYSPYRYSPAFPVDFGREINTTMCAQAQKISDVAAKSCGLRLVGQNETGDNAGVQFQLAEGHRVSSNISEHHLVVFADDQTAIVVPAPQNLPNNISYSAQTLGVNSQCKSVTRECLQPPSGPINSDGSTGYGNDQRLNLNCTQGGIPWSNVGSVAEIVVVNSQDSFSINTNPFNTGDIMYTTSYLEAGVNNTDQFISNTTWFVHGVHGVWNIVYCNVTVLSVTYRYQSSRYIMESYTPQSVDVARYIVSGGLQVAGLTSISGAAISHTGIQSISTFENTYSLELSRQLLAGAASIYEPKPVLQIQAENSVDGSRLQLIPLVLFIAALIIFLSQVLYITSATVVATWGAQYIGLAARHISDPIIAIQRLYGDPNPELTWEMDSDRGFGSETEKDRLNIGPVSLTDSEQPGAVFMVEKDYVRQSGGLQSGLVPDFQPLLSSKTEGAPPSSPTPDDFTSNLVDAQEKASRRPVVQKLCLISAAISVCTIGMVFTFLSYICVFHQCRVSKSSIISTAPLGPVLTISQVTSRIAPLSVPFIMGILSNLTSAKWLRSSADGGPNRPSPMQLGLLMAMFDGAGLSSIFSSIKYVFKGPKSGKKIINPPILRQCVVFLTSLLALTYIVAAADSWLHASSASVVVSSQSPYRNSSVSSGNFGREINSTMCAQSSLGDCGLSTSNGAQFQLAEGFRVGSNTSTLHRVVFADDQTALVVPNVLVPENTVSYSTQTLGVKSQCKSVTKQCLLPAPAPGGTLDYGDNNNLNINCTQGGVRFPDGYTSTSTSFGVVALDNQDGFNVYGKDIGTNPFNTADMITTTSYLDPTINNTDQFIGNTGWFVHGMFGAWNIVYCNVTVLSVAYRYESTRYITVSATPQPLDITRYIMSGGFSSIDGDTSISAAAISHTGVQSISTFEEAYSLELSRQLVAMAAYIYQPRAASEIQLGNVVNGAKLQLIPLVLFATALLIFLFQVLYIAAATTVAVWGVQFVGLAAQHLNNPIIAMQRLYGDQSPELTWEMDLDRGFGSESEDDRLNIGPVSLSDIESDMPGSIFMVRKGQEL